MNPAAGSGAAPAQPAAHSAPAPDLRARVAAGGAGLAYALTLVLIVALQFGPAIGLVGYRLSGAYQWALAGASRDLLVALLIVLCVFAALGATRATPWPSSLRWAVVMAVVYAALGLVSSSGLIVLALNLRRLILVPLLYAALLAMPWSRAQITKLLDFIVATSAVVIVLGLAERFAPDALWTDWLEIDNYNLANIVDRFGSISYFDSGRFFTWDLESWVGHPLRRMVSTYLEPTTLAAAMSVVAVMALQRGAGGRRSGWLFWGALACGTLTLSKGFGLFLLLLAAFAAFGFPSPRHLLGLALATAVAAVVLAARGFDDGPFAHLGGVASALHYLAEGHWLGEGIGQAGNYTSADTDVGGESGLGNAIGQAGVAALLQLLWVQAVARDVLAAAIARRDRGGFWVASWLLFWLTSYILSASSLGVAGNALGFLLLALYVHPASAAPGR